MEIQIIKDRSNQLLKRREITLKIKDKATPPRIEVKNKLAALVNSKPELIVIEHINTVFGKQEAVGAASVYESEERLRQLAHTHLIARDAPKVKEGAGEAAPAAKEPEAKPEPKAEAKPETKAEAKPKEEAKPKAEAEPKSKKAPKAEVKPETRAEAKAETKPEAKEAKPKAEGKKKSEEK